MSYFIPPNADLTVSFNLGDLCDQIIFAYMYKISISV